MIRRFVMTAAVAVAVGLIGPSAARADFQISLSDGTNSAVLTLTGGGATVTSFTGTGNTVSVTNYTDVSSGGVTEYTMKISFEGYTIKTEDYTSNVPGTTAIAQLSIGNTTVTNNTGNGTLILAATATNYSLPQPQAVLSASSSTTTDASSSATVSATAYYSKNGGDFAESGPGVTATSPINYSLSANNATGGSSSVGLGGQVSTSYSMTDVLSLTNFTGTLDNTGIQANIVATPAPSGLILAATMVPFFGLLRRKLRRQETPVVA